MRKAEASSLRAHAQKMSKAVEHIRNMTLEETSDGEKLALTVAAAVLRFASPRMIADAVVAAQKELGYESEEVPNGGRP